MSSEERLLFMIISNHDHGIIIKDLSFALQESYGAIKSMIYVEVQEDHIEVRQGTFREQDVERYFSKTRRNFTSDLRLEVDKNIIELHRHLQAADDGLLVREIASILGISNEEADKLVRVQYSKSYVEEAKEHSLRYRSILELPVDRLVKIKKEGNDSFFTHILRFFGIVK